MTLSLPFTHYSDQDIISNPSITKPTNEFKPQGAFWFARGDAWIEHCKSSGLQHEYRNKYELVSYKNPKRVLLIQTFDDAVAFEKKYGVAMFTSACLADLDMKRIDWNRVAQDYDAVYLPLLSYRDRCRLSELWAMLDVDSLVVFRLANVAVKLVSVVE